MSEDWIQKRFAKYKERQEREEEARKWQLHCDTVTTERARDFFRLLIEKTAGVDAGQLKSIGTIVQLVEETIYIIGKNGIARIWIKHNQIWIERIIEKVNRDKFDLVLENDGHVYIYHHGERTIDHTIIDIDKILLIATEEL